MNLKRFDAAAYEYAGESVTIERPLTAAQHAGCYEALGAETPPYDPTREFYELEPPGPPQAETVRRYLREQQVPHHSELMGSYRPDGEPAANARELDALLTLARRRSMPESTLDEAIHDIYAAAASAINNEGPDGQIRYLFDELGATETRRLITAADTRA